MVYCGKPSKGCQACRQRKTRCDRATPSCTQCVRTKRQCSGYRDQLDLLFRNESQSVIGKAKAKAAARTKEDTTMFTTPPLPSPVQATDSRSVVTRLTQDERAAAGLLADGAFIKTLLPSRILGPSVNEVAGAYFNKHYQMRAMGTSCEPLDYDTVDSLCSPKDMDPCLIASINAVGLASFSHNVKSPDLMRRALKGYGDALRLTNAALQSPTEITKDSTLFSVVILSIFETITGSSQISFKAWTEHIDGAAALIKLRGIEQFQTHAGRRMFMQVTSSLMISCTQRACPIPEHIESLRSEAARYIETSNPAWQLSNLIIECTKFRAMVRDSEITDPRDIIYEAFDIDHRLDDLFTDLPDGWQYETIYTDANPDYVWNGNYHSYKNPWIAQIWNAMRTCRMLLHEMIQFELEKVSKMSPCPFEQEEIQSLYYDSITSLVQTRSDVLASIPQHTGSMIDDGLPDKVVTGNTFSEDSPLRGSRGYFILWPLYLAGSMDMTTDAIRQWAKKRLTLISEDMGIRQAAALAGFINRNEEISAWERRTIHTRDVLFRYPSSSSHTQAGIAGQVAS